MHFHSPSLIFAAIVALIFAMLLRRALKSQRRERRRLFINSYKFPKAIDTKVGEQYSHLSKPEIAKVVHGLRDYFHICNNRKGKQVGMPSRVVDMAWHEFILHTREYQQFCQQALGNFLHHTPATAMNSPKKAQDALKRAWRLSCDEHKINPRKPTRLPLLFNIDAKLAIKNGYHYGLTSTPAVVTKHRKSSGAGHPADSLVYYNVLDIGGGCCGDSGSCGGSSDGGCSSCGGGCGGD